ncbi:uncharacterized protein LOC125671773 [Ostrea edulis]|uniref:uncharacterized protein LOC125671773 n=1 Tax=Ostrea edulis TaxID=37623 RepID=UPI0020959389|nr:uncharacterized protein LOC125671773 [Ostrea edulis]XP_048763619.1 uncharacterized protein LOC125671773 [Ostrea edulis]
MFVPRAHVHLSNPDSKRSWFSRPSRRNVIQRKLKWYECVRMPCLIPTLVGTAIGILILISGTLMSFIGYNPSKFLGITEEDKTKVLNSNGTDNTIGAVSAEGLKILAYVGPVFMGVGFFVMIIAVVLYCEIKEKYVCNILPQQHVNVKQVQRDVLYDMIINEFRKNYFRGIQVPIPKRTKKQKSIEERYPTLFKALSISTPALIITPEIQRKWKDSHEVSPNPSRSRRKKYIYDTWLKTSSLPNIRARSGHRQALRHERRHQRRAVFQDRLSKSCDHHDIQNNSVDTEKNDRGSCFDNPAFRTSPQNNTPPQIQVSPPTTPDTLEVDQRSLTQVSVHVDHHGIPNGRIIHSVSCDTTDDRQRMLLDDVTSSKSFTSDLSRSDARGFTLKSKLYPQSCIDLCDEDTSDKHVLVTLDSVAVQKNLQCQTQLTTGKKNVFFRNKTGPYKTLIGIFRSESCLDRIRKFTKPNSEKDNDSLDSFTLTDDVLKNFEMAEFSHS